MLITALVNNWKHDISYSFIAALFLINVFLLSSFLHGVQTCCCEPKILSLKFAKKLEKSITFWNSATKYESLKICTFTTNFDLPCPIPGSSASKKQQSPQGAGNCLWEVWNCHSLTGQKEPKGDHCPSRGLLGWSWSEEAAPGVIRGPSWNNFSHSGLVDASSLCCQDCLALRNNYQSSYLLSENPTKQFSHPRRTRQSDPAVCLRQ